MPTELRDERVRIPSYAFPEEAARALARAVRYGVWRQRPAGRIREFSDLRADEAAALIASALAQGGGWLAPDAVWRLLSCYGLLLVEQRIVGSARAAGAAARELGGPVALKATGPALLHKTEAGAVRLGLTTPSQVVQSANDMRKRLAKAGQTVDALAVQRMAPRGVEAFVGVVGDPVFGPVVACGAGGTAVELLGDVSVRIAPLTEEDASEMIRGLKTYPLFEGFRGAPRADVGALEDALLRVGALVESHPEVAEMDLNPVVVLPSGAIIVDARIRLEPSRPQLPLGARRPA